MKNFMRFVKLMMVTFLLISTNTKAQDDDRGFIVEVGQVAPDFSVTTTDGNVFKLSENKGKVIMIEFTASWCGVCRKEMPHIENEIWLPMKDKNLVVIGIDRDEPLNVVTEFAKKIKVTYPLGLDPGAGIFSLYANKNSGVTRNIIIDRKGTIVYLTRLYETKEFNAMKDVIHKLVNQN